MSALTHTEHQIPQLADDVGLLKIHAGWLLAYGNSKTRTEYARDWRQWAAWCADRGLHPLAAERGHVDAYARTLEEAGYAPATVGRRLTALSSFYTYGVQEELLARNPVAYVRRPKVSGDSQALGLDRPTALAFLRTAEASCSRDGLLANLLLLNGLRVSEATGAQITDLRAWRGTTCS